MRFGFFPLWVGLTLVGGEIPASLLTQFAPLPAAMPSVANPATPEKVSLGRMLFFEPRISGDQKVACNTCHDLARAGTDGRPTSAGVLKHFGTRNTPTVFNAVGNFAQFWDGRSSTLELQVKGPILNAAEMGAESAAYVARVLSSIPEYVDAFRKAFPGDPDPVNLGNAALSIAAFERLLLTPSRWDRYLGGDRGALSDVEKNGFMTFVQKGCDTCHRGALLGGHEFRKLGARKDWPNRTDLGREAITKDRADRMMFKVPSLRNVSKTAPYLHDGSIADLETAIIKMGEHQCGKKITFIEARAIAAWLESLSGEPPFELLKSPVLPGSTPATPKPTI